MSTVATSKYEPIDLATFIDIDGFRPMAGRCVVKLDKQDAQVGSILIPESAQDLTIDNRHSAGTVLKMYPRRGWTVEDEAFKEGDRVIIMLLLEDLTRSKGIVLTMNTRIYAVIEAHP